MASRILTLAAILYFAVSFLSVALQVQSLSYEQDTEDEEEYVLDTPFMHGGGGLRRSLASTIYKVKKGARCNAQKNNICNGVYANKGTSFLNCCKKHCRNIYGDRNNCGRCGRKCGFGQRCCNSKCTNIVSNSKHCGKCGRKCAKGVPCQYGVCGYA